MYKIKECLNSEDHNPIFHHCEVLRSYPCIFCIVCVWQLCITLLWQLASLLLILLYIFSHAVCSISYIMFQNILFKFIIQIDYKICCTLKLTCANDNVHTHTHTNTSVHNYNFNMYSLNHQAYDWTVTVQLLLKYWKGFWRILGVVHFPIFIVATWSFEGQFCPHLLCKSRMLLSGAY